MTEHVRLNKKWQCSTIGMQLTRKGITRYTNVVLIWIWNLHTHLPFRWMPLFWNIDNKLKIICPFYLGLGEKPVMITWAYRIFKTIKSRNDKNQHLHEFLIQIHLKWMPIVSNRRSLYGISADIYTQVTRNFLTCPSMIRTRNRLPVAVDREQSVRTSWTNCC